MISMSMVIDSSSDHLRSRRLSIRVVHAGTAIMGLNPLEPKAPVSLLPPEIWDEILGYIPTDRKGRLTLIACALVATWWTEPSQRRLFSSVKINDQNRERWISGVILSESRNRLLQYIRSLQRFLSGYRYPLQKLLKGSGEYLFALRSLELANIRIERLDKEELHSSFSAFRETLTNLTLKSFTTSFTALITLVDYFPNITSLQLGWLSRLEPDEGPFPLLSQPLRGRIHICPPLPHCLEFIDRFAKLDQEYEEMVIDSATVALRTEYLERILKFSAGTVKHLRLLGELDREVIVTIDHFRQLQELELVTAWSGSPHEVLISSITSTELRKIILRARYMHNAGVFAQRVEGWASVDKSLCELVARLGGTGYRHTLEVELRLSEIGSDYSEYEFTKFLPEFRENGVVTIIDALRGDRVLHSSPHSR